MCTNKCFLIRLFFICIHSHTSPHFAYCICRSASQLHVQSVFFSTRCNFCANMPLRSAWMRSTALRSKNGAHDDSDTPHQATANHKIHFTGSHFKFALHPDKKGRSRILPFPSDAFIYAKCDDRTTMIQPAESCMHEMCQQIFEDGLTVLISAQILRLLYIEKCKHEADDNHPSQCNQDSKSTQDKQQRKIKTVDIAGVQC